MKKTFYNYTISLIAGLIFFTCCSKTDINGVQEPTKIQTYKMSITASKKVESHANSPHKALGLDATGALTSSWAADEKVTVYNRTKGANLEGELQAESAGASVQLTGNLSGLVEEGDELTLKFLAPNYANQEGSLEYISSNCDYATASVFVASISEGTIYTAGEVNFQNQQAIVKFTLKNDDGSSTIDAQELVIDVNGETYTITPTSATSQMYVAIPGFSDQNLTMSATSGSDTYSKEVSDATLINGHYYLITVLLNEQTSSIPEGALSGRFSVSPTKQVYFSKGNLRVTTTNQGADWTWSFAEHQYDFIGDATTTPTGNGNLVINGPLSLSATGTQTVDLFGWIGNSATSNNYGINNSTTNDDYGNILNEALKTDWGTAATIDIGSGWRTLTKEEWMYLINVDANAVAGTVRTNVINLQTFATVNGKQGLIIMPDDWTANGVNLTISHTGFSSNIISLANWEILEQQGCVFLPAAGIRSGTNVTQVGNQVRYWTSTASSTSATNAYSVFYSDNFPYSSFPQARNLGCGVRLVRDVE